MKRFTPVLKGISCAVLMLLAFALVLSIPLQSFGAAAVGDVLAVGDVSTKTLKKIGSNADGTYYLKGDGTAEGDFWFQADLETIHGEANVPTIDIFVRKDGADIEIGEFNKHEFKAPEDVHAGQSVEAKFHIMDERYGGLSFDDGSALRNLVKSSNSGQGTVVGTGKDDLFLMLGEDNHLQVIYANAAAADVDTGAFDTASTGTLTTFTHEDVVPAEGGIIHSIGPHTVEADVGFRVEGYIANTSIKLFETCTDGVWAGGTPHRYGIIGTTVANDFATTSLSVDWPVGVYTALDLVYTFDAPVTLNGTGTWGSTWAPARRVNKTPLTWAQAVYYDEWAIKTYGVNDKIVQDGIIYRCTTAGSQVGTFAANSSLWVEVGNIPSVMTYKSGISVTNFNALTTGAAGDFYRISDTGTLTGGQGAVVGDQVVVNTTLTGTIAASEFDYFPNQEPGIIVPPWSASTYALDDVIYEGGVLYYCTNAGAQITDFATNTNKWSHHPKVNKNLKPDSDNSWDIGASSNSFRGVYVTQGVYYDSNLRLATEAAGTRVFSPDNSRWINFKNDGMWVNGGHLTPGNIAESISLGTLTNKWNNIYLKGEIITTATGAINDGTRDRVIWDAGDLIINSPDGAIEWKLENTGVTTTSPFLATPATFKLNDGTNDRITYSATGSSIVAPNGTDYWTAQNAALRGYFGATLRINAGAVSADLYSPDGNDSISISNTRTSISGNTKLGSGAPAITMKKLTGTTAATEGTSSNITHGIGDYTKILGLTVFVNDGGELIPPGYYQEAGYHYTYKVRSADVQVINHNTSSENIKSKDVTILLTVLE